MKNFYFIFFLLVLQQSFGTRYGVAINPPMVSISYPSSIFCHSVPPIDVMLSGSGNYSGGIFSSTIGLIIDPVTGRIFPGISIPGTYSVEYTLAATAQDPAVSASTNVTIVPMPTAAFSTTNNSVCVGSSTFLCIFGTPNAVVDYNMNGVITTIVLDATGNACIVIPPLVSSTLLHLISVTSEGAVSCTNNLNTSTTISVSPLPQIQMPTTAELIVEGDQVVSPLVLDTQLSGNYSFQWFLGGLPLQNATESTYIVTTASDDVRNYSVKVNDATTNCESWASCLVTQTNLGLEGNAIDLKFGPNPFLDNLEIISNEIISNITVHNLLGQCVFKSQFSNKEIAINLSHLATGTYFVKAESEKRKKVVKVVKH